MIRDLSKNVGMIFNTSEFKKKYGSHNNLDVILKNEYPFSLIQVLKTPVYFWLHDNRHIFYFTKLEIKKDDSYLTIFHDFNDFADSNKEIDIWKDGDIIRLKKSVVSYRSYTFFIFFRTRNEMLKYRLAN